MLLLNSLSSQPSEWIRRPIWYPGIEQCVLKEADLKSQPHLLLNETSNSSRQATNSSYSSILIHKCTEITSSDPRLTFRSAVGRLAWPQATNDQEKQLSGRSPGYRSRHVRAVSFDPSPSLPLTLLGTDGIDFPTSFCLCFSSSASSRSLFFNPSLSLFTSFSISLLPPSLSVCPSPSLPFPSALSLSFSLVFFSPVWEEVERLKPVSLAPSRLQQAVLEVDK